jgi:hypothetical protein
MLHDADLHSSGQSERRGDFEMRTPTQAATLGEHSNMTGHIGKPKDLFKTLITRKSSEQVTPWHYAQHQVPNTPKPTTKPKK